jgi:hypothetical protein
MVGTSFASAGVFAKVIIVGDIGNERTVVRGTKMECASDGGP